MRTPLKNRAIAIAACAALLAAAGMLLWRENASRAVPSRALPGANVLLITLDTTRADRIGAYGWQRAETPHLDALAREGIVFENCIAPSGYTLPSHSSIMTGLYPPRHGVRLNGEAALADSRTTLAERLSERGYATAAFVAAFVLDKRWGLAQGFDHYDDEFQLDPGQRLDLARVQRPADEVVDAALEWLEGRDRAKAFFGWVHLYDPHVPYDPPEPFRSRFAAGGPSSLYDGEIAFVDSQLARLLKWLDRENLANDTVVIVVGDHGEGLGSHGEGEHGYYVYDYTVRVPLILRVPGVPATRVRTQVRTIDLLPTLADLVMGQPAEPVQGTTLLPLLDGDSADHPPYAYSESMVTYLQYGWSALYSLRTNDYKYIEAPRRELYELGTDPGETVNRFDDMRRVALELRNELTRMREEDSRQESEVQEANLDEETLRMLASLGYVGGASVRPSDDGDLADPKDKLHLFESVGYAGNLMSKNEHREAAEVLEIILEEDPAIPQARFLLASVYRELGERQKAGDILDAYLREEPDNLRALMSRAEIFAEEGRRDEVLALARRVLASDEQNARAYELMADVYMGENDHASALPLLRKAVEIQPKLSRSRINLAAARLATGDAAEAERELVSIIEQHPKFPLANFHLGLIREQQGRFGEARRAYRAEIENNPKTFVARVNLGTLLLRLGEIEQAEAIMRESIELDPDNPRPYLLLGQALLSRPARLPEVERLARDGLRHADEPEMKALGYFLLADVYSRQGRGEEEREAARMGNHYRAQIRRGGPASGARS
ncbi:MAG TPA: sulfatase-like hydrolase/transferase [Thermoanaerobaculia bacterium]|nr:sulfatase-like hydrolase/transferase [Thermoanaerobaculia bacterium]